MFSGEPGALSKRVSQHAARHALNPQVFQGVGVPIKKNAGRAEELAARGLLPRPSAGASRRFPPPAQVLRIRRSVPMAGSRRALRTLWVFSLMSTVSLVFADARSSGAQAPDHLFAALLALSALVPAWVWVRSRYVDSHSQVLHGFAPGLLAALPGLAPGHRFKVWQALDDWVDAGDLVALPDPADGPDPVCTSARRDLAFELSGLNVRPRLPGDAEAAPTAHAQRAVQTLCWVLADTLGLRPVQVRAMYPVMGESDGPDRSGRIDFVMVVVLGGRQFGTDVVCEALREAAATVALRYEFQQQGRPAPR